MPQKPETTSLVERLRRIAGRRHVFSGSAATRRFSEGYRSGGGLCDVAVQPGSLIEMWRVLQACVAAEVVVIFQAANTGLTGGSTPWGGYDRPVVIVSTRRLTGIRALQGGAQVVCLPGATLFGLERTLAPLKREPHSVIGSSCIGASVVGGICNNSGGALVRRGPAYTELALVAQLDRSGELRLVNHLGIALGEAPEEMLARLDAGEDLTPFVIPTERSASDGGYAAHVRDVEAATPARYNADPRRLFEASGSAGKVAVFAVRLDTFAREPHTATFYVGANAPASLERLRRRILTSGRALPISGEYMHRTCFDIADRYGKDLFLAIALLGTERLPALFRAKGAVDAAAARLRSGASALSDRVLQALSHLAPDHLPVRMRAFRDAYEHHLIIKVGADAIATTRDLLAETLEPMGEAWFECAADEAELAFRHRFVAAGAAVRHRAVHPDLVEDIVALDVALRRNDDDWFERLPPRLEDMVLHKLYYGHFFCHVLHQDYVLRKGVDPAAFKRAISDLLDARGAEYPAEHNVGHLYKAKPGLAAHYRDLDPQNLFNPGVGGLTKERRWGEA